MISTVLKSVCSTVAKNCRTQSLALLSQGQGRIGRSLLHNSVLRRAVVTSPVLKADAEWVDVVFVLPNGKEIPVKGKLSDNLLDVVVNNNVDLDGYGACEGTLSCSTCHVIFDKEDFDKIEDKITDEEMDMLDLAYGLTDTSRLGCQVCLTKKLQGVRVQVPAGVHDQRS